MSTDLSLKLPEFLEESDGEIRITGHRISIVDLLYYYREGYTSEMLAARYPTLTLARIHYVIGFYHENQPAVDSYLNQYLADCDRLREEALASPNHQILRQRLLAMREAQFKAAHAS